MRLQHLDAERIEFAARRRTRASLWVGLAFALVGGSTATAASEPIHWMTATASLVFGLGLMAAGWPTRRSVVIDRQGGVVRASGTEIALGPETRLQLTGGRKPDDDSGTPLYRVELVAGERAPIVILEDRAPDRVLAQLERIAAAIDLSVEAGWGLPSDSSTWLSARHGSGGFELPAGIDIHLPAVPGRRRLAALLFALTGLAAVLMLAEVLQRIELGDPPTVLGLTLPIVSILALSGIAAAVGTYEIRLSTTTSLAVVETRLMGLVVGRQSVDRHRVVGMYAVSPLPGDPIHSLLVGEVPLALPEPQLVERHFAWALDRERA